MRKKVFLFLFSIYFITIGWAYGAVRSATTPTQRSTQPQVSTPRSSTNIRTKSTKNITQRNASSERSATTQTTKPRMTTSTPARSGLLSPQKTKRVIGRAATNQEMVQSFGSEYSMCHDAYFTCMDQFCANLDESYRRCICSSRLNEIKKKQSTLTQTADSLTNFRDFNLDIITKSAAEVNAMTSATSGEQIASTAKDNSASNKQLNAISSVLAKTKSKSLSTAGTLDAGGDIKSIWNTTDLASGANIANLTGEPLYNAVNAQCSDMVAEQCSPSILNMVISAYGMYIENDCATLATNLSKQKNTANASIRETERDMGNARLENYDAHNSLSINDCIASIRNDITANTACGPNFVHCLDVTGLYLNIDTGAPIYTENFYNLANQISLSGNILHNQKNHMIINELNKKKVFAQKSLDKCRDLSASIWDEFMRQAIIEIHQAQQDKIRNVKNECLGVVNKCYDTQTNQLKDFSKIDNKTLLGLNLETVEDLCREKLNTCSNLYGGGPNGLDALVNAMHDIVNQKIAAECQNMLFDFGKNLCNVPSTDTLHSYPYACRVYTPGDQRYATIAECNAGTSINCGDYNNSLYQSFVNYAMQVCIRPSEYEVLQNSVPTSVLQDINIVMDKMHIDMSNELSRECERFGGIWVTNPYTNKSIELQEQFYTETGSDKKWGYCKSPMATAETYVVTFDNQDNSNDTFSAVVTYGETMSQVSIPTTTSENTRSVFCGYYTSNEDDSGVQYYNDNGDAIRNWDIASNTTLFARYGAYKSITFRDDNEGDVYDTSTCPNTYKACNQSQSVTCKLDSSLVKNNRKTSCNNGPSDNQITSYTFNGWCDGTCTINDNKSICNGHLIEGNTVDPQSANNKTYCATWTRTCTERSTGVTGNGGGSVPSVPANP